MSFDLQPASFDDIPGWQGDDHAAALAAFCRTARLILEDQYSTKKIGPHPDELKPAAEAALALAERINAGSPSHADARAFFEHWFEPRMLLQHTENGLSPIGKVTAYFEPVTQASKAKSDQYPVPLYRRPPDLIDIDDHNRPPDMDPYFRFARKADAGISPYFDRAAISAGCLNEQGLELAWVKNPLSAYFIHIQGSARLAFDDGSSTRIAYAAKTGHPYTSIGKYLIDIGELELASSDMAALHRWFECNPDRTSEILNQNRSFIFFRTVEGTDPELGPIGATKVQLQDGRSLAVDKELHTYGLPIWVSTAGIDPEQPHQFDRLMIAQDTGSAIVGPVRGDLFVGSGEPAGQIAGRVNQSAKFTLLWPRSNP
ncbi:MAG: MltA domain-containing protein [Pseudomonadota bacterium]